MRISVGHFRTKVHELFEGINTYVVACRRFAAVLLNLCLCIKCDLSDQVSNLYRK